MTQSYLYIMNVERAKKDRLGVRRVCTMNAPLGKVLTIVTLLSALSFILFCTTINLIFFDISLALYIVAFILYLIAEFKKEQGYWKYAPHYLLGVYFLIVIIEAIPQIVELF